MLNQIKLLLGLTDTSKDELILILIERAMNELIDYTHSDNLAGAEQLVNSMVIYNYNRLGTIGITSENYSGVTFQYESDYPESILKQMKARRKLRVY